MDNEFYRNMLDNIYEGIYFVDNSRKINFWNKGAERITGFSSQEVLGHYCYENILNHVDDDGNHLCMGGCPLHKTIDDGQMRNTHVYLLHKSGHRVAVDARTTPLVEDGKNIGAVEMFVDQGDTFQSRYNLLELKKLAMTDQLTNLPNRRYLDAVLGSLVTMHNTTGIGFGVCFFDVDHFKLFNDNYGHLMGDRILKMVGETVKDIVRSTDHVGRWGGEEFLIIFPGIPSQQLSVVSEKIRMLIENSGLREDGNHYSVTVSGGAACHIPGESAEALIARADQLMYKSKNEGRNRISV